MAENRSLSDALTLTPEKLAFIQGEGTSGTITPTASERPRRGRMPKEKTVDVELSHESPEPRPTPRISRSREKHAVPSHLPNASEVLDEVLVPLTTRIPHRLIQSLRRVCLERQLLHQKPDSIQEFVQAAIENWLSKQG